MDMFDICRYELSSISGIILVQDIDDFIRLVSFASVDVPETQSQNFRCKHCGIVRQKESNSVPMAAMI